MENNIIDTLVDYYINNKESILGNPVSLQLYQSIVASSLAQIYDSAFSVSKSTVAELDMDGVPLFCSQDAKFASTKKQIKELRGSVTKATKNQYLIADTVNKKAIIVNKAFINILGLLTNNDNGLLTESEKNFFIDISKNSINTSTGIADIIWQYDSDRYVCGFYLIPNREVTVNIYDDAISLPFLPIRQNSSVIWENNSSSPLSIYSGTTNYDLFYQNPDLSQYGKTFKSSILQPGDRYTFQFATIGEYNWFTYPNVLTGVVSITNERLSSLDEYLIVETDGLSTPFSSRIIKIDSWGNVLSSFGEGFLVKPRVAKPLLNGKVIIST